jgi:hypothetical protein
MAIENTVVEAINKWQLDQRVHGDEEAASLTALTNALKGSDRLEEVREFFSYLNSATKYRSIWIPQIAALMNAVNQAAAKKSFEGSTFVVARDGFGWLEEQHRKNQPRFDAGIDKWTKQLPERLAAIHTANGEYRSKGLLALPAALADLVSRVEVHNRVEVRNPSKVHKLIGVPPSVERLVAQIQAGRCSTAGLGDPIQQVMAWPLTKSEWGERLSTGEARDYLDNHHSITISDRTLSGRAAEFPQIKVNNKYIRDELKKAADAGAFIHRNSREKS